MKNDTARAVLEKAVSKQSSKPLLHIAEDRICAYGAVRSVLTPWLRVFLNADPPASLQVSLGEDVTVLGERFYKTAYEQITSPRK